MVENISKSVALIVAHPDDETLWAGGTILSNPLWQWFIVCVCRRNDKERATKFAFALKSYRSLGIMGDLDDEPEQKPLRNKVVEQTILQLLPLKHFDLVITHNPNGEYTKHIRHEEIGKAVITLWNTGKLSTNELWIFAYEDGNKKYLPRPIEIASLYQILPPNIWKRKYEIITQTYGFKKNSWEAETTPRNEAFWKFTNPHEATDLLKLR